MASRMALVATGDSFITRRLPSAESPAFRKLVSLLRQADVRFTNLEVTVHDGEGVPSAVSGGTWAAARSEVLRDLQAYGFNLIAWANNHTLDYLYEGLRATENNLDRYGFVHAGVGQNLAKASEVKYLETGAGRVALIAAASTFHESWAAGEQRPDMIGRPGVNPLRYETVHMISQERMQQLKEIAAASQINAEQNLYLKEGFAVGADSDLFQFGGHAFRAGEIEGKRTSPNRADMQRILRRISEARRQADVVLVSIHAHEMKGEAKDQPADFLVEFSRACIDEGAHAVIGHGPHILRAVEIYKERPIFYSLGNFIFQNDSVTHLPADFYEKYGLDHAANVSDALDKRSLGGTRGLGMDPKVWSSVIPHWVMEDGRLKELALYPIELGFDLPRYRRGWPELSEKTDALENLRALSEPFGTRMEIGQGVARVIL